MMRLNEEQKCILTYYSGGKTKIVREMNLTIEEFRETGSEPMLLELMEDMVEKLRNCTNKEFFAMKKERLIDTEEEEAEDPEDRGGVADVDGSADSFTAG